jgi:protein-S-isoprenylcysteine O-methyltransferase Ste14
MRLFLKVVLFTLVAPGMVTVYLPALLLRGEPGWRVDGARAVLGGPLILAGALLYACCAYAFARFGQGTPAPIDPPRHLVSRGLYARTRNPMYLGVITMVLGEAVVFGSSRLLAYASAIFTGFHLFVVLYEEPAHRRRFGADFEEYCRRVPRWVPRLWRGETATGARA